MEDMYMDHVNYTVSYGPQALANLVPGSGSYNEAIGDAALVNLLSGSGNTAMGNDAMYSSISSSWNTAIGPFAMYLSSSGDFNTALGWAALASVNGANANNTIVGNIGAYGFNGSSPCTTGHDNIDIGAAGVAAESGIIRIGTPGTHTNTYFSGVGTFPSDVTVSGNTYTGLTSYQSHNYTTNGSNVIIATNGYLTFEGGASPATALHYIWQTNIIAATANAGQPSAGSHTNTWLKSAAALLAFQVDFISSCPTNPGNGAYGGGAWARGKLNRLPAQPVARRSVAASAHHSVPTTRIAG